MGMFTRDDNAATRPLGTKIGTLTCPNCRATISLDDVNVSKDVALCRACRREFTYSDVRDSQLADVDLLSPPAGASYEQMFDHVRITATTRHAAAFFLVPFMIVWSGGALGGIYGSQIFTGKFNLGISLFGIPFIIGAVLFWSIALMAVGGKVVVRVGRDYLETFTGFGGLGFRKRISTADIAAVREGTHFNQRNAGTYSAGIVIKTHGDAKDFTFGKGLNEVRRNWMRSAIVASLAQAR